MKGFETLNLVNIKLLICSKDKWGLLAVSTTSHEASIGLVVFADFETSPHIKDGINQGSQYRTEDCIDLASDTIYFGYRSIPVYRFRFTAIYIMFFVLVSLSSCWCWLVCVLSVSLCFSKFVGRVWGPMHCSSVLPLFI